MSVASILFRDTLGLMMTQFLHCDSGEIGVETRTKMLFFLSFFFLFTKMSFMSFCSMTTSLAFVIGFNLHVVPQFSSFQTPLRYYYFFPYFSFGLFKYFRSLSGYSTITKSNVQFFFLLIQDWNAVLSLFCNFFFEYTTIVRVWDHTSDLTREKTSITPKLVLTKL